LYMKKYLVGFAALALAIGIVITGCQNPAAPSGPNITENYTFTGADSNEYVLVILDDGTYTLTTIKDGKVVTSTGTYSESGGTKTLHPEGDGTGTITVNPKTGGGADITVNGEIPFTDPDGNNAEVALPEGNVAAEDKKPGQNSLVISGLGGIYKNGVSLYVGALESKEFDPSSAPDNFTQGTVTGGSLTVALEGVSGSNYTGFSSDGVIVFMSKTTAAFSGGTVAKAYPADFELYTWSINLGDMGLTSSMAMNAVIQAMSEGMADNYDEWKTVMQTVLLEEFGDGYVSLGFLPIAIYKDAACTQEFSGADTIGPDTVIYTKFSLTGVMSGGGGGKPPAGYVNGTLSFTGYTGDRPRVVIAGHYSAEPNTTSWGNEGEWLSDDDLWDTVKPDGSFSIPFSSDFLTVLQTSGPQYLCFSLWIGPDGYNGYGKNIEPTIQVTSAGLSGGNLNVGSIGPAVDLTTITLSGTLTVTYNGQPVPHVQIGTSSAGVYGSTGLVLPGPNAPWTMLLPAFDSPTNTNYFTVIGYEDEHWNVSERLFDKDPEVTVSVHNTDVDVPPINLGNIEEE
jgi:hypothetical protein